jgi:hypothetical protein
MTFVSFLVGAVIGGVIAVVMILAAKRAALAWNHMGLILAKTRSRDTMWSDFAGAKNLGENPQLLPYGVPLSIGSVAVLAGQTLGWWVV